jgi:hypothetical protein
MPNPIDPAAIRKRQISVLMSSEAERRSHPSDFRYNLDFETALCRHMFEGAGMRTIGILLMAIGVIWVIMCFVGIAMMSRSVDMFTEAFLPSLLGFAASGFGLWMFRRARYRRS